MIDKWQKILSLNDWTIVTEPIEPESVTYDPVCPVEDRYYVGVHTKHLPGFNKQMATIYHDRELTERDVIHELLHVRYPDWTEKQVNEVEELLYNINQNEN
jgi:hypothetical protein